ncbi:NADH:flavin oxidoreductase/NADH oxidase [Pseudarthrobacter sp. BRE9]|uniref:NADH:flavin oxidoreductase/NADH oxidase n=1 Tax=Pseudarthrobacter sp. BRE9 TaxID=2962582 RepID=UPI0028826F4B|nr:NADH:flavin oxidoreductase/NADH oxidase [Pseudarthrobacter sp. BRE9]MDT0170894.1 NADH:flavin oxidoreductase/NADH oxidase [Pseudarthrobacter sp. BRE9]
MEKFSLPLKLRALKIPNRIWMSPMCQYSAKEDGVPTSWHMVHYGSRAVGGAGMVMVESTAVGPRHRTTPHDLGIWSPGQVRAHRKLAAQIKDLGAVAAVQLQSAGRKSSHMVPWLGKGQNGAVSVEDGGWIPMAPSSLPFGQLTVPDAMTAADMEETVEAFAQAAVNAAEAGYDVVEIHAAHGYLLHQFLSPVTNRRNDGFGGGLENRMRLPLRVCKAVRDAFPQDKPVFVRITATDWIDGGITLDEAIVLAGRLAALGIDLLDVTSGALAIDAPPPNRQGLNLEFAEVLKDIAGVAVAPVGQLSDPELLRKVAETSSVDAVIVGRALLRDPYFALRLTANQPKESWPSQYHRAL